MAVESCWWNPDCGILGSGIMAVQSLAVESLAVESLAVIFGCGSLAGLWGASGGRVGPIRASEARFVL